MTRLKQISEQVVARFGAAHRTLGTAESLTGGMIASSVAGVSGASAVLMGGVVSYDPRVKHEVLGVSQQVIDTVGVVSEPCARQMAEGAAPRAQGRCGGQRHGRGRPHRRHAADPGGHGISGRERPPKARA